MTYNQERSQNTWGCSKKGHQVRSEIEELELIKLVNGKNVSWVNPMIQSSSLGHFGPASGIRGHRRRLFDYSTKCVQRANFFTNRVVSEWNALSASVIESVSVNHSPEGIKAAHWNCSHTGNITLKTVSLHTPRREKKRTRPNFLIGYLQKTPLKLFKKIVNVFKWCN